MRPESGFVVRHSSREAFFHEEFGLRGGAVGADTIFDGHDAGFIFTERSVNHSLLRRDVAVDKGEVFLLHGARFPDFPQFTGDFSVLGDENEAGRFAIEAMDQMGNGIFEFLVFSFKLAGIARGLPFQMNASATDEAGIFVAFGGMANKVGRFVHDENVGILVDDGEQFFQAEGV